ncbi:MAG: hypothetical protein S0880_05875 [Actinomycetota bacterium]|nr:hypothetical protein [Actinomycetota bacterium]
MGTYLDRLRPKVGADLEPGEILEVACRVLPLSAPQDHGVVATVVGGARHAIASSRLAGPLSALSAAPFVVRPAVTVGVSDRHLLIWRTGQVTGNPKTLMSKTAREFVSGASWLRRCQGGRATGQLTVSLTDGSSMSFGVHRRQQADGARIAATINTRPRPRPRATLIRRTS